jgi:nucleoside-diphosphate-sugar epimerase
MMDFTLTRNSNELPSPMNLGNPEPISMLDLAKRIISITNSESELQFLNRPQDDPNLRMPNIKLAMKTLGWQPRISLQEGLEKTVHYFRGEKN